MTIRRNPNRGDQETRDAFVDKVTADDKKRLHCFIPAGLHHQMKLMALEGDTDMTALVVDTLENYVAEHQH